MKRLLLVIVALLIAGFPFLTFGHDGGLAESLQVNEETRQQARQVKLKSIKKIRLYLAFDGQSHDVVVTRPEVIKSPVEGLKEAIDTRMLNQLSLIEVIDTKNNVIIYDDFSLKYPSHAISPQFVKGLREAGVVVPAWEEEKVKQETTRKLCYFGLIIGGVILLFAFVVKRK